MKALTGARLIDCVQENVIENAIIIIDDDTIHSCGAANNINLSDEIDTIDFSGKTIIPGLIDAHTHICFEPAADTLNILVEESDAKTALKAGKHCKQTLEAGFTTIRDVGGKNYIDLDVRNAINNGDIPGPRILSSGKSLTMTGGHGWPIGEEVDGISELKWGARKQIKNGVDLIKLMATGGVLTEGVEPGSPQLTVEEMEAAIKEANKADRKTAAHAQGNTGIKNAIKAGIDSIEHGVFLDQEAIEMMVENDVYLVPTLTAIYWMAEKGVEAGIPDYAVRKSKTILKSHIESFKQALKYGVKIAMGTDAGSPFNYHGENSLELVFMVKYGMTEMDAIKSATIVAAELLGLVGKIGTVETGKKADLVVLDKNPLENIENIKSVHQVYKDGRAIL